MCLGPPLEPSVLARSGEGCSPVPEDSQARRRSWGFRGYFPSKDFVILAACLQGKSEGEIHTLGKASYLVSSEQH